MTVSNVSKAIGAFLTAFATWLVSVTVSSPAEITSGEWVQLAGIVILVLTVYVFKNEPAGNQ